MIYSLQLPKPSDQLINLIKESALSRPLPSDLNDVTKKWVDSFVEYSNLNVAKGEFFSNKLLDTSIKEEFQSLFKYEIHPIIGIFHNTKPDSVASYPPHTDYIRSFAINYYIELGGDEVTTVLYEKKNSNDVAKGGIYGSRLPYDKLNIKSEYVFIW